MIAPRPKKPTPEKIMFTEFQVLENRNKIYRSEVEKIKNLFHF